MQEHRHHCLSDRHYVTFKKVTVQISWLFFQDFAYKYKKKAESYGSMAKFVLFVSFKHIHKVSYTIWDPGPVFFLEYSMIPFELSHF